jgi:uncharacterized RDD family membrane protein YckC
MTDIEATVPSEIAGFWHRLLAHFIDALIWTALTTLIGLALVSAAPDLFGLSKSMLQTRECRALETVPGEISVPPGISRTERYLCSYSTLGLEFRREVIVGETVRTGFSTISKFYTVPVDQNLRPTRAVDVDIYPWLLFVFYVVFGQAYYAATFGKRLLRLRMLRPDGSRPGIRAAVIRNLVLWAPAIVWGVAALGLLATGRLVTLAPGLLLGIAAALALLTLAIGAQVWWTASHRRPSIHDRIAGTVVVHGGSGVTP